MCARKQTPDILTEIMEGISSPQETDKLVKVTGIVPTKKKTTKKTSKSAAKTAQPKPEPEPKPAPKSVEKTVKYEYVLVSFQHYNGWRPRFVEGKEVANWMRGPLIHEYIDELSAEGWELAAASGGECMYGTADRHQLFFKRAK